ncbi:hypothetical protein L7F22_045085 [Adiantum nelumboides]|nr:hypothetical protein [Adiantum nelumboides]
MMSRTTASNPPVNAASRADVPSARATTSIPSAVSPRRSADRTPASSSTTSTLVTATTVGPATDNRGTSGLRTSSAPMRQAVVMGNRSTARRRWTAGGIGAALAAAVGIGLVVAPGGASAAPELPPVSPEELVSSVLTAKPGPFDGTVALDNRLGLPALPGVPQAANGTSTARIWSGDDGKGRVSLPTAQGEKTYVADGTTLWSYDSENRTVTKIPAKQGEKPERAPEMATTDPAAAAAQAIGELRTTSTVSVDGTAEIAGRPAYQLVLDPKPTERTLLREVRIAVDAEKRVPLQLSVLANGSPEPAFQVGFTDVTFGPQDASLFAFTPPPGSTVQDQPARPDGAEPAPGGRSPVGARSRPPESRRSSATGGTPSSSRAHRPGRRPAPPSRVSRVSRVSGAARTARRTCRSSAPRSAERGAADARSAPPSAPRSSPTTAGSPPVPSPRRSSPRPWPGDGPYDERRHRHRRGHGPGARRAGAGPRGRGDGGPRGRAAQGVRPHRGRRRHRPRRPGRLGLRDARPERLRQDHADPDAARPDPAQRRHRGAARTPGPG